MDTHKLARILLEGPKRNVTASVDVSTGEHDHANRAFGDGIECVQYEPDGLTATLIFTDGYVNGDVDGN